MTWIIDIWTSKIDINLTNLECEQLRPKPSIEASAVRERMEHRHARKYVDDGRMPQRLC